LVAVFGSMALLLPTQGHGGATAIPDECSTFVYHLGSVKFLSSLATWLNKHQIWLYISAMVAGGLIGSGVPAVNDLLNSWINPFLAVLLYVTFLSMPLTELLRGFRDVRFIAALIATNFVAVPALVFLVTKIVHAENAILIGVALVLLAPCVDYVIVFSGLAGGANDKLLAATPLLLGAQMLLIPAYMSFIVGRTWMTAFSPKPFLDALVFLIAIPLVLAIATQLLKNRFKRISDLAPVTDFVMVPAMMGTLLCVVGSQILSLSMHAGEMLQAILAFILFIPVAGFTAFHLGKAFGLNVPSIRAITFSGVTRNSLVILPIALALPAEYSLAPTVVVTQTLIELVAMLVMIKVVPVLIRTVPHRFGAS